jgi:hypothetical protein
MQLARREKAEMELTTSPGKDHEPSNYHNDSPYALTAVSQGLI